MVTVSPGLPATFHLSPSSFASIGDMPQLMEPGEIDSIVIVNGIDRYSDISEPASPRSAATPRLGSRRDRFTAFTQLGYRRILRR